MLLPVLGLRGKEGWDEESMAMSLHRKFFVLNTHFIDANVLTMLTLPFLSFIRERWRE